MVHGCLESQQLAQQTGEDREKRAVAYVRGGLEGVGSGVQGEGIPNLPRKTLTGQRPFC